MTSGVISTRMWLSNHTDAPALSIACSRTPRPKIPALVLFRRLFSLIRTHMYVQYYKYKVFHVEHFVHTHVS